MASATTATATTTTAAATTATATTSKRTGNAVQLFLQDRSSTSILSSKLRADPGANETNAPTLRSQHDPRANETIIWKQHGPIRLLQHYTAIQSVLADATADAKLYFPVLIQKGDSGQYGDRNGGQHAEHAGPVGAIGRLQPPVGGYGQVATRTATSSTTATAAATTTTANEETEYGECATPTANASSKPTETTLRK